MRTDIAPPSSTQAARRDVSVTLYRSGGPAELILGTAGDQIDLTPFVASGADHTDSEATLPLRYHAEIRGAARPKPGQVVAIRDGGDIVFSGIVDAISRERETRGERSMTLTVRRRDATPWWREVHGVSDVYGVGADIGNVARDVARYGLGLRDAEMDLPLLGVTIPHDSVQLADITRWDMLSTLLQPALREPWVDALGRLKSISRDVRRDPDLDLAAAQVVSVETSGAKAPITSVKVKWLDPALREVVQVEQMLTPAQLVVGLFTPYSSVDVRWSADGRQRAKNTSLRIISSVGIVGNEWYDVTDEYGGRVRAQVRPEWLGLFGASLAAYYAANQIPEPVVGVPPATQTTVPWYKAAAKNAAMAAVWVAVAKQGFGTYELWGQPYDFVHSVNETEAYDAAAPAHAQKLEIVENYVVPSEAAAQALAVTELAYRVKSASGSTLVMVDDRRLERGDLLRLPDGRRFYVLGYKRGIDRGAAPTLDVSGFCL